MRAPSRRSDDADVIRARLRALLADAPPAGWVPAERDLADVDPATAGHADDGAEVADPVDEDVVDHPGAALPRSIGRHRSPAPAVRMDPGRLGARGLWLAAAAAVLLLVGWTWWSRPDVAPVTPPHTPATTAPSTAVAPSPPVGEASTTSGAVVVAVVGKVGSPGLVTLPAGSRVADAVAAAGGLRPDADPASVNLAAPLTDGQQVAVGVPGAVGAGPVAGGGAAGAALAQVSLATATATELDTLPGIGPVLAQRIVDHRTRNGPFGAVGDLEAVPGIGPALVDGLSGLVTP